MNKFFHRLWQDFKRKELDPLIDSLRWHNIRDRKIKPFLKQLFWTGGVPQGFTRITDPFLPNWPELYVNQQEGVYLVRGKYPDYRKTARMASKGHENSTVLFAGVFGGFMGYAAGGFLGAIAGFFILAIFVGWSMQSTRVDHLRKPTHMIEVFLSRDRLRWKVNGHFSGDWQLSPQHQLSFRIVNPPDFHQMMNYRVPDKEKALFHNFRHVQVVHGFRTFDMAYPGHPSWAEQLSGVLNHAWQLVQAHAHQQRRRRP